jgi:hypothetical protein
MIFIYRSFTAPETVILEVKVGSLIGNYRQVIVIRGEHLYLMMNHEILQRRVRSFFYLMVQSSYGNLQLGYCGWGARSGLIIRHKNLQYRANLLFYDVCFNTHV